MQAPVRGASEGQSRPSTPRFLTSFGCWMGPEVGFGFGRRPPLGGLREGKGEAIGEFLFRKIGGCWLVSE